MSEAPNIVRPIRWSKLRRDEAERVIRQRCADSDNVIFGTHAFRRMNERSNIQKLYAEDAYVILESGSVKDDPVLENGEWKVVVIKRMPGTREAGGVTLFTKDGTTLFIKTVEWMDWQT
jgi:hypothetical protein